MAEMKAYIATQAVRAAPMRLGDYDKSHGQTTPQYQNPEREGYRVVYANGNEVWSPKETFERACRLASAEEDAGN